MRTRIFDNRVPFNQQWRWGQLPANSNPAWSTAVGLKGEVTTIEDFVNTRFKERSGKGEVINTPFSLRREITDPSLGPYLSWPHGSVTEFGDLRGLEFPSTASLPGIMAEMPSLLGIPTDHTDMMTRVGTSAMARISSSSYSGLVSAGELGETLRYLRNPIQQGLSLAASIERKLSRRVLNKDGRYTPGLLAKRLDQPSSKSIAEEASSLYLQLMYGMRPLVKEISDLAEALTTQKVRSPRETSRSQEGNQWQGTITRGSSQSGISFIENLKYQRNVIVRAGCMYHFLTDIESSNRKWGVRLSDIPSALWALTPSSFVLDWFVNTNQLLSALTPKYGLVEDATWTSVTLEETLVRSCSGYSIPGWTFTNSSGGTGSSTLRIIRKDRRPSLVIGLAPTRVTSGLVDLSLGQTTSLFAMMAQRLAPLIRELGKSHASRMSHPL
jgi:hypothetical protein